MSPIGHPRPSRGVMVVIGSVVLVAVAACGSATDLAGQDPDPSPTATGAASPPTSDAPEASPTPARRDAIPQRGDCRVLDPGDLATRVTRGASAPVPCAGKHNAQTYAVTTLSGKLDKTVASGPAHQVYRAARAFCDRKLRRWLGSDTKTLARSQFAYVVGVPTSTDLGAGARWARCDVYLDDGTNTMVQLPRGTKGALKGPRGDDYHSCVKGNISTASDTVPCYRKHRWRSVSSIRVGGESAAWPGSATVRRLVEDRCGDDVRSYLNTRGSFRYGYVLPTKRTWKRGERYGVCFAHTRT